MLVFMAETVPHTKEGMVMRFAVDFEFYLCYTCVMFAFHHIPKCAGSTLQTRMCQHEHGKELASGSTLIRYDAVGREWEYKVCDDADYNPKHSLHDETFPRHRGTPVNKDHSAVTIVMGHAVDHTWPGQHITWIRNPYQRDVSHYNYDYNLGRINRTWQEWHWQMPTDWITLWLYTRWLGQPETDVDHMYQAVTNSKLIIRPMEQFESDYEWICKQLGLTPLTVRDNVQTEKHLNKNDLALYDELEHREDNEYDWMLWESSVRNLNPLTHP